MFGKSQIKYCSCSTHCIDSRNVSKSFSCDCYLKNDLHQVCELEKVAALLKEKLKNLKDSRNIAQKKNRSLIRQSNELMEEIRQKTIFTKNSIRSENEMAFEAEKWSQLWLSENGQKILADKRLLENAQQVKVIEKQIEYTNRLIAHKRKIISAWQNDAIQKVHKEGQLKMLEEENLDMEKKMTEWLKVNQRLSDIYEVIKDREVEVIFATERCKQRNLQAREECSEMQAHIFAISKKLDEISVRNLTNTSSSSITLHSQEDELKSVSIKLSFSSLNGNYLLLKCNIVVCQKILSKFETLFLT
uniref:Coiled-coil domain-containing protein 62 n=1 Tax=Elaeophora elaphi TaxID=1147741 RepID=A0A0R3RSL7_9BILA